MTIATARDDLQVFTRFMTQREAAASAYANGNAKPVDALLTQHAPSSFFGPLGGHIEGVKKVASTHAHGAESFQSGGHSKLEILQMGASGGLAYWVGLQHVSVHMSDSTKSTPMNLRVTEVFRFEDTEWKLVHRHADTMAALVEKENSKEGKESA